MKLIIAGSRTINLAPSTIMGLVEYWLIPLEELEIVSGKAVGMDSSGEHYAAVYGFPCYEYPANWAVFGKSAGPRRNEEMAQMADALLCVWDGQSRGSRHMIETMRALGKPVYEVILR